jgi:hypothetical protein
VTLLPSIALVWYTSTIDGNTYIIITIIIIITVTIIVFFLEELITKFELQILFTLNLWDIALTFRVIATFVIFY